MPHMITEKKLINLISKSLKIDSKKLSINSKINEIEEWDSLGHLAVFFSIDKETNGKASKIKKLADSKSIKNIFDQLKKNKLAK